MEPSKEMWDTAFRTHLAERLGRVPVLMGAPADVDLAARAVDVVLAPTVPDPA